MTVPKRRFLRSWALTIILAWAATALLIVLSPGFAHADDQQSATIPDFLLQTNAVEVDALSLSGIRGRGNSAKVAVKAEVVGVVLWDELGTGGRRPPGLISVTGSGNLQGNQLSTLRH